MAVQTHPVPPPSSQPPPTEEDPKQTQSWAAWLLDAYASTATSPITSEYPADYHDEEENYNTAEETQATHSNANRAQQQRWFSDSDTSSRNSTLSPVSANSYASSASTFSYASQSGRSVSAYGSYAGSSTQQTKLQQQPYTRTGRGGAGNMHWGSLATGSASVADNTDRGVTLAERRAAAKRLQRVQTEREVKSVGRGGAGNYATGNANANAAARTRSRSPLGVQLSVVTDVTPAGSLGVNANAKPNTNSTASRSVSAPNPPTALTPTPTTSTTTGAGGGYGRGGAGNQGKAEQEKERKRKEVQQDEMLEVARRRREVEVLVDGWLRAPPVAMVGVSKRGSWVR